MTADIPKSRKVTDEEGNVFWEATDGSRYKTRAGAYKKSKKLEPQEIEPNEPEPTVDQEPDVEVNTSVEDPEWASFSWSGDDGPVEFVPTALKKVRPKRGSSRGKPTKQQLAAEKSMNIAILKVGYRSADYAMTKWKRGVLQNPDAQAIAHTESDYDWIADVTDEALADQGLNIGSAVGPGIFAIGANAVWFGKPIMETTQEAKRLGLRSKIGLGFGKIFEKVPFLGKSIKARRLRKEAEELMRVVKDE